MHSVSMVRIEPCCSWKFVFMPDPAETSRFKGVIQLLWVSCGTVRAGRLEKNDREISMKYEPILTQWILCFSLFNWVLTFFELQLCLSILRITFKAFLTNECNHLHRIWLKLRRGVERALVNNSLKSCLTSTEVFKINSMIYWWKTDRNLCNLETMIFYPHTSTLLVFLHHYILAAGHSNNMSPSLRFKHRSNQSLAWSYFRVCLTFLYHFRLNNKLLQLSEFLSKNFRISHIWPCVFFYQQISTWFPFLPLKQHITQQRIIWCLVLTVYCMLHCYPVTAEHCSPHFTLSHCSVVSYLFWYQFCFCFWNNWLNIYLYITIIYFFTYAIGLRACGTVITVACSMNLESHVICWTLAVSFCLQSFKKAIKWHYVGVSLW